MIFPPSPEEIKAGIAADGRVRRYERYIEPHQWQLSLVIPVVFLLLIVGVMLLGMRHGSTSNHSFFIMLPALLTGMFGARYGKKKYAADKELLAWLEKTYGDDLPWVVERKQLAASDELEQAIRQFKSETKA